MSNFPSYMAWGASVATYARVANLEHNITQLTDALISELDGIHETLYDSLGIQQELLNREVFQSNIEEFIYQLEKSVKEVENPKSGDSPVVHFFRLSYFLHTVDQEQINTSIIKGRENKAAFDRAVSTALKLCNSLRTNGEVIAAVDQIEREEARIREEEQRIQQEEERRRRSLREEELRRQKRTRKITMLLIASVFGICIIYIFFKSETWSQLNLELRAYRGSSNTKKTLAQMYYDVQDYTQAFKWFKKAAEQGDPESQFYLGRLYFHGVGVSRDREEGVRWLCKASAQDFEPAQKYLRTGNIKCNQ